MTSQTSHRIFLKYAMKRALILIILIVTLVSTVRAAENMDKPSWQDIVRSYGKVLEDLSQQGYVSASPESSLPFPREAIKQAILEGIDVIGESDQKYYEQLKTGYVLLGDFVPDEEANLVRDFNKLLRESATKLEDVREDRDANKEARKIAEEMSAFNTEKVRAINDKTSYLTNEYLRELSERLALLKKKK